MRIDHSRSVRIFLVAGILTLATSALTLADSVELQPVRDNTLLQDPIGALSNGSGPVLFAGINSGGTVRRAVLLFDVAAALPPGSVVTSATLTMQMDQTNSGNYTVSLHRVSAAWGEGASSISGGFGAPSEAGDATWIHTFYADGFWANAGGDFVASSASTEVDAPGSYVWGSTPGMIGDVQGWLDQPATNHGWLLKGDESSVPTVKRFGSRENNNANSRPRLTVEFEPPPTDDDEGDDEGDDAGPGGRNTDQHSDTHSRIRGGNGDRRQAVFSQKK